MDRSASRTWVSSWRTRPRKDSSEDSSSCVTASAVFPNGITTAGWDCRMGWTTLSVANWHLLSVIRLGVSRSATYTAARLFSRSGPRLATSPLAISFFLDLSQFPHVGIGPKTNGSTVVWKRNSEIPLQNATNFLLHSHCGTFLATPACCCL